MTVRKGTRVGTDHAVLYLRARGHGEQSRYGFIVSKAVGNAVHRNLVRRRLRSIGRELLESESTGRDIVIRALPGVAETPWAELRLEITDALERGKVRR